MFFTENLRRTLAPITDSEEELNEICTDKNHPLWRDHDFAERLGTELGDWYKVFQHIISEMNDTTEEILVKAGVKDHDLSWLSSEQSFKYQFKRVKVVMNGEDLTKVTASLSKHNSDLRNIRCDSLDFGSLRQRKRPQARAAPIHIRKAATNIHWALSASRWLESVEGEVGKIYANVVSRCLHCRFDLSTGKADLENAHFRQEVHDNAVIPLEELYLQSYAKL